MRSLFDMPRSSRSAREVRGQHGVRSMSALRSYQEWVQKGSFDKDAGFQNTAELIYIQMGISGEAGEVTEVIKKYVRDRGMKAVALDSMDTHRDLVLELGDVMWYMARMCNLLGISFEELIDTNIDKLCRRHKCEAPDVRFD